MSSIKLQELTGGVLQKKFGESFQKVIENLKDPNTPYKNKRELNIKLKFTQNEARDDVKCEIQVSEKLAPATAIETSFAMDRDLETGEVVAEEYGSNIRGQMSFEDVEHEREVGNHDIEMDGKFVDIETGEIKQTKVVDFQKAL